LRGGGESLRDAVIGLETDNAVVRFGRPYLSGGKTVMIQGARLPGVLNTFLSHPICSCATLRKLIETPQMKKLLLSDFDRLREKIGLAARREQNQASA
jgi:hypothetical protein